MTWACPQQLEFLQRIGTHLLDGESRCEDDWVQAVAPGRPLRGCLYGLTGELFLFLIAEYSHLVFMAAFIIQVVRYDSGFSVRNVLYFV